MKISRCLVGSVSGHLESKKTPKLYKLSWYSCCCTCPYTDTKCIYDSNTNSLRLTCLSQAGFILWSQPNAFMAKTGRFLANIILYWDPKPTLSIGLHRSIDLIPCQSATVLTKVNEKWKQQEILPCMLTIEFDVLSQVNTFRDKLYCSYMCSCNFWKAHWSVDMWYALILSVQQPWAESMKYFYQTEWIWKSFCLFFLGREIFALVATCWWRTKLNDSLHKFLRN